MIAHDDGMLDDIAVLALGALPEQDARELLSHIASCDQCRRAYADFRGAADMVGYAAESEPGAIDEVTSARMKARVMREVRVAQAAAPVRVSSGRPWWAYAAAAAAIVVALLSSLNNATLRSQNVRNEQRITSLEARAHVEASAAAIAGMRIAQLTAPGSKRFPVPGGQVITSGGRVYFALHHLSAPPHGKVYQAWTLAAGAKAVAPSITFSPDPSGVTVIELPRGAAGLAAVAVSVEPVGGSKAPTSKPRFIRPLS